MAGIMMVLAVVFAIAVALGGISVLAARSRATVAQWAQRRQQSERAFLEAFGIDPHDRMAYWALALRAMIAELGLVPAATIHATDTFRDAIDQLPYWDSLDVLEFLIRFELQHGIKLTRDFAVVFQGMRDPGYQVRDFVLRGVEILSAKMDKPKISADPYFEF